jgi:hypothetical protein
MRDRVKDGSRRRSPRFPIQLQGSLVGRVERAVQIVDLSVTGCLVQCDTLLDQGAILDLRLPVGGEIAAKVRVATAYLDGAAAAERQARFLAGLEFLGLPPRAEAGLRQFLEQERRRRRSADAPAG